jgi:hypothetical protein
VFGILNRLIASNNHPFARKHIAWSTHMPRLSAKRAPKAHLADARTSNCLSVATERLAKQKMRHLPTWRTHFRDANATNPDLAHWSRSEPQQEVRASRINRRAHLISSRPERGPHGEWPPTITIWKEDGLAVRNASARVGRSHPRTCQRSGIMALADNPREPSASAKPQDGREEAED